MGVRADVIENVRGLLRETRNGIARIQVLVDAVLFVRRTGSHERILHDVLKTCRLLDREQFDLKQDAAEAHLRTQRRAGELLLQQTKHRGGRPKTVSTVEGVPDRPPTLRELGVEVHESHRWQRVASIPGEIFEEFISTSRESRRELTISGALAVAKNLLAEGSGDAKDDAAAATARSEYYRGRSHVQNLLELDPRALAADLRGAERRKALEELERFQHWISGFASAIRRMEVGPPNRNAVRRHAS